MYTPKPKHAVLLKPFLVVKLFLGGNMMQSKPCHANKPGHTFLHDWWRCSTVISEHVLHHNKQHMYIIVTIFCFTKILVQIIFCFIKYVMIVIDDDHNFLFLISNCYSRSLIPEDSEGRPRTQKSQSERRKVKLFYLDKNCKKSIG